MVRSSHPRRSDREEEQNSGSSKCRIAPKTVGISVEASSTNYPPWSHGAPSGVLPLFIVDNSVIIFQLLN